jgi:aminoglycoside phosphotransferase (APT) family kinase protein
VFVKSSAAPNLAAWLRREHEVYAHVRAGFMPELVGWDDDGARATLLLEDLSGADWSVGWSSERIAAVKDVVAAIAEVDPPPNTIALRELDPTLWTRWQRVAEDPGPFLSLAVRDARWLERSLPVLLDAVARAPLDATTLCHFDLRSDNMCFRDGHAVLVDWNWALLATSLLDLAAWAPSAHLEGAPPPWTVVPDAGDLAAVIAGFFASVAGLPPPETAPRVREIQRAQLVVALDWVDRELF